MPSMFNRDAGKDEQVMGRWSRRLGPLFVDHAGAAAGERLLEVGCGTGSLTFTLARRRFRGAERHRLRPGLCRRGPGVERRSAHPDRARRRGQARLPRRTRRSRVVAPGPALRGRSRGGDGGDAAGRPPGRRGRRGGVGLGWRDDRHTHVLGHRGGAGPSRGRHAGPQRVEGGDRPRRARIAVPGGGVSAGDPPPPAHLLSPNWLRRHRTTG